VPGRGAKKLSYKETTSVINSFYKQGGRTLYLEGGEPFLWRDGKYSIDDIVEYSHKLGYYSTVIYTNGTIPINTNADTVFISIDGLKKTHDFLRGKSFDKIEKNILDSSHASLYINYTINNHNKDEIEEFCKYVEGMQQIRGIFFYFHTPYYGYDELYLEAAERNNVILNLLKLKKRYKILNSIAGLKCAIKNDWKRPLNICQVYEKGTTYNCCRFSGDPDLCRNCGYLSYAEIHQTLKLKPTAILNALKYF